MSAASKPAQSPQGKIVLLLRERGWSQSELARRAGINQGTLNAIIRGNVPRVPNAIGIARTFGVPVEWLFDVNAPWPPPDSKDTLTACSDGEVQEEAVRRFNGVLRDLATAIRAFREALARWEQDGLAGDRPPQVQQGAERLWNLWWAKARWHTFYDVVPVTDVLLRVAQRCLPDAIQPAGLFDPTVGKGMVTRVPEAEQIPDSPQPLTRELVRLALTAEAEYGLP